MGIPKECRHHSSIWICDQELRDLPQLSLFCEIAYCAPCERGTEWTKEAIDVFKFYVGTGHVRINILVKTVDQLIVDLYDTPDDKATLMALTRYSTLGQKNNNCSILA